ncbi:MAG: sensor domain-containing diguanylate cyclase [Candidatus Omnitrophica bacterium]|nr:sensor domain-containing diguanylate cyclase [Candidatus Omnitrophota bacterium]
MALKWSRLLNGFIVLFSSFLIFFLIERELWIQGPGLEDKVMALFILFAPLISFTVFTFGNIFGFFYFLVIILFSQRFLQYYQTNYILPLIGIAFSAGVLSGIKRVGFVSHIKIYKGKINNLRNRIALLSADIEDKNKVKSALTKRFERFYRLKLMADEFSTTLDLVKIIQSAGARIGEIIPKAENVLIYLVEEEGIEIENPKVVSFFLKTDYGPQDRELQLDIFDRWLLREKGNLIVNDVQKDFRFSSAVEETKRDFRALLACPLSSEDRLLGVVRLESSLPASFTPDDLRMLDIFSDLVSVGVENAYLYQKTEELAKRDGLTNLFLPRYLYSRLEELMVKSKEFSVLILDLDYFKDYNDRYGHIAGDIMLKKIARILSSNITQNDFAVRYGGEEFLVVLGDSGKERAIRFAEEIRERVDREIFYLRREATHVTISIGIAIYPYDGKTKEEIIHKADECLYSAKAQGRNRIAYRGIK